MTLIIVTGQDPQADFIEAEMVGPKPYLFIFAFHSPD
jgi:hypothetical protein